MSVICDRLAFFLATQVSFTNITDRHDIIEILLKEALNTLNQTKYNSTCSSLKLAEYNYCSHRLLNHLAFQYVDLERTVYLINDIPEVHHVHWIRYLHLLNIIIRRHRYHTRQSFIRRRKCHKGRRWKHWMQDPTKTSIRLVRLAHRLILTEVSVPIQDIEGSCIYVLRVSVLPALLKCQVHFFLSFVFILLSYISLYIYFCFI